MLAHNQDNVFKRDYMSTHELLLWATTIKRVGLVQSGYHCHLIEI
jgi:hypothetical protein